MEEGVDSDDEGRRSAENLQQLSGQDGNVCETAEMEDHEKFYNDHELQQAPKLVENNKRWRTQTDLEETLTAKRAMHLILNQAKI